MPTSVEVFSCCCHIALCCRKRSERRVPELSLDFVQLGSMVCNSRELTSLESRSTRDGPRPPARRHPSRALQPHEPWPGRPSAAGPWHRPSPLRPTAALLLNGLALRLARQSCVSMHPIAPRNTSHPGSTAAAWLRHAAVLGQHLRGEEHRECSGCDGPMGTARPPTFTAVIGRPCRRHQKTGNAF